ncbi:VOC family protein [Promicromonospora umidemergens]|uniref:VOC family protein n=1 Tax=Promicromonospora umidemergens TaxID=629679 RepID=UPI0027E252B1|nr:VOC family protein [Promicromonospora umidemergens]
MTGIKLDCTVLLRQHQGCGATLLAGRNGCRTGAGRLSVRSAAGRRTNRAPDIGTSPSGPGDNHSVIIEFLVDDVDRVHENLTGFVTDFVNEPTTMPWGNRSLLFRDPDGNLVNFFTPV